MMKAALEEYNQKNGNSSSFKTNTLPPQQSKSDNTAQDETRRRRGATVIGNGDRPNFNLAPNNITGTVNDSTGQSSKTSTTSGAGDVNNVGKENESYNSIKMRYLRSLKIPISMPQKEPQNISASAPIPIPIAFNPMDFDSDEESDYDKDNQDDDDDDDDQDNANTANNQDQLNGFNGTITTTPTLLKQQSLIGNNRSTTTVQSDLNNNINNHNNQYSSIGSSLLANSNNKSDVTDDDNNTENTNPKSPRSIGEDEVNGDNVPTRKDSRKHKFIPPHELMTNNTGTIENMINHSLPGNNRKKLFGQ